MSSVARALALGLTLVVCACSPSSAPRAPVAKPPAPTTPRAPPKPSAPVAAPGLSAQDINGAVFVSAAPGATTPPTASQTAPDPVLVRAEVLLDRAGFSPGVIDGRTGSNLRKAVAAFQLGAGVTGDGQMDQATWAALTRDSAPVAQTYVITPADAAGPFAPDVGEDFVKLAALPEGPQYSSPLEALSAQFHMSQALMLALNPGADFTKAGTSLLVAAPGAPVLTKGQVARIVVSKSKDQVFAYDSDDKLLAVYPATVGSKERPSPHGLHKIKGVGFNPTYTYDPSKLHWGPRSHGKFVIKAGPKGPVGVVWIDINAPSYGIHGSPDPNLIGKTASHGCVRLTNWDALALAHGVKPGVPVSFEG